jgi:uncharacterized protein
MFSQRLHPQSQQKGNINVMQALIFLAFIILVYFLIRFLLNTVIEARSQSKKAEAEPTTHAMVRCAHCGVHLPQSEAYFDGQHTYCSEGHMKLGPRTEQNSAKD